MAKYPNLILSGTKAREDLETEGLKGNNLFVELGSGSQSNITVGMGTENMDDLIYMAIESTAKQHGKTLSDAEYKALYEKAREQLEEVEQQARMRDLMKGQPNYGRPGPYGMAVPNGWLIKGWKEGKFDKPKDYILHKDRAYELQPEQEDIMGDPIAYHVATITASAGTIFDRAESGFNTSPPSGAGSFVGRVTTAEIRARGDGTSPTASVGLTLKTDDFVYMSVTETSKTEFIRTTSTSGVIEGHFYPDSLYELRGRV